MTETAHHILMRRAFGESRPTGTFFEALKKVAGDRKTPAAPGCKNTRQLRKTRRVLDWC